MAVGTVAQLWQHVQQLFQPPKPLHFRGFPVDPVLARRTGAPPDTTRRLRPSPSACWRVAVEPHQWCSQPVADPHERVAAQRPAPRGATA